MKKIMKEFGGVALISAALIAGGCGHDDSSAVTPVTSGGAISGKLVDGYVSSATMTLDLNDDRVCGAGEPTTRTDASGNFTFSGAQNSNNGSHMICATGGTDASTGLALVGTLTAPPGSTSVTPLTSLVMAQINESLPAPVEGSPSPAPTATISTASSKIATNLGLTTGSSTVNLLSADPVALATTVPKLAQTTTAVQVLLVQAANNVAAAATGTTATSAQTTAMFSSALKGVAQAVAAQTTAVDLTDNSTAGAAVAKTMVTTAISKTVTAAQSNTTASAAVSGLSVLSGDSVAKVAATSIVSLAQAVAAIPAATLIKNSVAGMGISGAAVALTNTKAAQTTALFKDVLTKTVAASAPTSLASLETNAAAVLAKIEQGDAAGAATAAAVQTAAVNTAAPSLAIKPPTTPSLPTNTGSTGGTRL